MTTKPTPKRPFIKGLRLSELFYEEAVKPILTTHFPELTYIAALSGYGSDCLGFDTPQSMDHDWGPKLMLFLTERPWTNFYVKNYPSKFRAIRPISPIMKMARNCPELLISNLPTLETI